MAITLNDKGYSIFGDRAVAVGVMSFDSSYAYGGESINLERMFGIHHADLVMVEPKNGYSFEWDHTNSKLKVYAPAPPIIYEEYHLLDNSYQFTTDYPPAFFMNVAQPGQNIKLRSTGIAYASLSQGECSLTALMAAGSRSIVTVRPVDLLGGDGAFTGAATNWTLNGVGVWAYDANNVTKGADGADTLTHDTFAAVVGKKYRLSYTISGWTVGTVTPTLGGAAGTAVGADGTYTEDFTATTTGGIIFTPTNTSRFTIDSVTIESLDATVCYVTQAWKDVWDNLVQDEVVTLASGDTADMAYAIAAVMYADRTSATAKALAIIDEDDTAASGEIALYFGVSTAQIKATHADENTKSAKITYIKKPSAGFLSDRAFKNEGATKAGADPYTNTFDYPILLWGYSGQMPVNGQATERLIDYAGTPASGECVIDWFTPGARGAAAPATGTVVGLKDNYTGTAAGIWGVFNEIYQVPLEIKNGENLSALTGVRIIVIGQ